jgi:hypothetical protein
MSPASSSCVRPIACALGLACALACGAWPSTANAQGSASASPEDAALAETLFRDGRTLLEAGKVDAACTKLEASQKLDPKVGTLLNVAACHELQGRTASAWAEFLEAARMARVAPVRDPRALEQTARSRAEALGPRIHRLAIEHPEAIALDVEILLDGRPIPRIAWSTPIPVDPGEIAITAQAPGKAPWTGRVDVTGAPATHSVAVPALAALPSPPPPVPRDEGPAPAVPEDEPSRLSSAPFLGGAGVAVVGIGVGSWLGLRAIASKKSRDRECDETGCSPLGLAEQHDAKTAATVSTIAVAVGGAGALFAIYWIARPATGKAGASAPTASTSQSALPIDAACVPGPWSCALQWRGGF